MAARVHNIPAHWPFVDALAAGLLTHAAADPAALARMMVLLPTRRACRAMRDAFLRASAGKPLLLPRLQPIGDVDEDELILGVGDPGAIGAPAADLPSPIDTLRRRILLGQIVARSHAARLPPSQALWLAQDLAGLIDEVETERLSFDRLAGLVPDDYAEHWQQTLRFLTTVTKEWPAWLRREETVDPAAHRNEALKARAEAWHRAPPPHPVIAAGSTGSIPATADLLAVVAQLPNGTVIVPGLDRTLSDQAWERVAAIPNHPQFGLARLLARLGLTRDEVGEWGASADPGAALITRGRLLTAAIHPPDGRRPGDGLDGDVVAAMLTDRFRYVECAHAREEAAVIAYVLREALETPGRTAALVTPDRELARRVAAALRRWQIVVDDSGGTPLAATPPGTFLRLVLAMAAEQFAPVPLLAVLKHPFASCGRAPSAFRALVRRLELLLLRGVRPGPGVAGLRAGLDETAGDADVAALIGDLERRVELLTSVMAADQATVPQLLEAQLRAAEGLAASVAESGAERLWRGESGEAAARFADQLAAASGDFEPLPPDQYPALFDALLAGLVVRPRYGTHPRLSILGPLEARLQSFDVIVLGGLNEGTWPPTVPADPWMSRPMRERFGLPPGERRVGQAAHDFAQSAMAASVVLTRSRRIGRQPTQPSRWLLRIEAELRGLGLLGSDAHPARCDWPERQIIEVVRERDTAQHVPIDRPTPRPPLAARPRHLSVTRIETWLRDPYSIYAREILRLKPLDDLDADPTAADLGTSFHDALAAFLGAMEPGPLPLDALSYLMREGDRVLAKLVARPAVWAFWKPRFARMAAWFVAHEAAQRACGRFPAALECRGSIELAAPDGPFVLRGTADRIDCTGDGSLAIVDYKTGTLPSGKDVETGVASQLPLEALLVARGGFPGVSGPVAALEYWRLTGRGNGGEIKSLKLDVAAATQSARGLLEELIAAFCDPGRPYASVPNPALKPRFNDFEHLARIEEWLGGDPD